MIFDTDVMIWAFRGNEKALDAIDNAPSRAISAVTYMELLQGVRNKKEMKRFLSALGFATLPVTANISSRAVSIMEETALKSDLGVADALIFATGLDTGDTLLSGNAKHFKEVPLLDTVAFRA